MIGLMSPLIDSKSALCSSSKCVYERAEWKEQGQGDAGGVHKRSVSALDMRGRKGRQVEKEPGGDIGGRLQWMAHLERSKVRAVVLRLSVRGTQAPDEGLERREVGRANDLEDLEDLDDLRTVELLEDLAQIHHLRIPKLRVRPSARGADRPRRPTRGCATERC